MKKSILFSLVFLTLVMITASYSTTIEDVFKKRITVKNESLITLSNTNGNITVESWDLDQIEIIANKKTKASSSDEARELMDELKVEIVSSDNEISIKTIFPHSGNRNSGFFSWLFSSNNGGASVSYILKVPQTMDLNLNSTNGDIHVENCKGRMRFKTTNGNIYSNDISGAVRCVSTNGSLKIYFKETDGDEDMSFKTTNGTIKLYLPQTINASLIARTRNGKIKCSLPLNEIYKKTNTKLEAAINNGGPNLTIKTTNGNIYIKEN